MKTTSLAVAALLTTLSAAVVIPAAYADNATTQQATCAGACAAKCGAAKCNGAKCGAAAPCSGCSGS